MGLKGALPQKISKKSLQLVFPNQLYATGKVKLTPYK